MSDRDWARFSFKIITVLGDDAVSAALIEDRHIRQPNIGAFLSPTSRLCYFAAHLMYKASSGEKGSINKGIVLKDRG